MSEWYRRSTEEVLRDLRTTTGGLTSEEAARRLAATGPNRIDPPPGPGHVVKFLGQFRSLLTIILLVASLGLYAVGEATGNASEKANAYLIVGVVLLNVCLGYLQAVRAERALSLLQTEIPTVAHVMRDGELAEVPAPELVPGDIVLLEQGDRVPADLRLIEAEALEIDESHLTGENPVQRKSARDYASEVRLGDRDNLAHFGTEVRVGHGTGVVVATGKSTEVGRIAQDVQTRGEPADLQVRLDTLSRQIGAIAGLVCALVLLFSIGRRVAAGLPPVDPDLLLGAVSLAVAVVPEGLPIVVLLALSVAARAMAVRAAVVTTFTAMESIGATTVVCTDKTGTLTEKTMVVRRIMVGGHFVDVSGEGYNPEGGFFRRRQQILPLEDPDLRLIVKTSYLCNDARFSGKRHCVGDPVDAALLVLTERARLPVIDVSRERRIDEIPFDSESRMMATICAGPSGTTAYLKGAPEVILPHARTWRKEGQVVPLTPRDRRRIKSLNQRLARRGYLVLGLAYRPLDGPMPTSGKRARAIVAKGAIFLGLVAIADPLRASAPDAIRACRRAGMRVVLLTGDQRATAAAVGRELGLIKSEKEVFLGSQVDLLDDTELAEVMGRVRVGAQMSPIAKQRIVAALRARGESVAMIGDGINDAPAMVVANTAVAMGSGADVARGASDLVLLDDDFSTVVEAVAEGRKIHRNTRNFLRYQLSTNLAAVVLTVAALFTPGFGGAAAPLLPLLPIQLLWTNLVLDSGPALALGADPDDRWLMRTGPPKGRLVSRQLLRDILLIGLTMGLGTFLLFVIGDPAASLRHAQTMAFIGFGVFQVVNAFNCSAGDRSLLEKGIRGNRLLLGTGLLALALQLAILYIPGLGSIFGTEPLGWSDWGWILLFAPLVIILEELRKARS